MKISITVVFIGFLVFSTACRKLNYKDTTVEVYVENISLHEPLVNHPVMIKERSSTISGNTIAVIDRQFTDEDGMVYFDVETHKHYDYEVVFDYRGGWSGFATIDLGEEDPNNYVDEVKIKGGEDQCAHLKIARGGALSLYIKNSLSNADNQVMMVQFKHQNGTLLDGLYNKTNQTTPMSLWEGDYFVDYYIASEGDTTYYHYDTLKLSTEYWPTNYQVIHEP